uniref:Uncharacterized protein n=1 Tax=Triticum urartu TaxID=4572 RepID=A0A8R7QD99_TRIUA
MGCWGVGQEVTAGAGWVLGGGGRRKLERGCSCCAMKVERGEVPEGRERWASGAHCRPWRGRGGLPCREVQARGRGVRVPEIRRLRGAWRHDLTRPAWILHRSAVGGEGGVDWSRVAWEDGVVGAS